MREEPRRLDALLVEYTEVNQKFRALADTRFKLLAFIPSLGAVALFVLSRMQQGGSEPKLGYGLLFLLSCLGFFFTLGVMVYSLRNDEISNALVGRARYLERQLQLPPTFGDKTESATPYGGQFHERPTRNRRLFGRLEIGYDTGLAIIYGAVLGEWFYPLTSALLGWIVIPSTARLVTSLVLAVSLVALFVWELLRMERGYIHNRRSSQNFSSKRLRQ